MTWNPRDNLLDFAQRNIDKQPDDCVGIYGFWCNEICLYIGKTEKQSLRKRLSDHFLDCHNKDLKDWFHAFSRSIQFSTLVIEDTALIHAAEREFIEKFNPRTNKTR